MLPLAHAKSLVSAMIHVVVAGLVVLFTPCIVHPHPRPERADVVYNPPPPVIDHGVLSADVVEVQVTPYPGAPTPRYPEALRAAGIEGDVTLEFVVDTTGRVEGGSVRVLSSAADAFVVSVRDALAGTRYHPALVGGRRVRQLVRQGFVFSLTRH